MLRNREITVQGWTEDGPAFIVTSPAQGWRNRRARRAGNHRHDQRGPHDLLGTDRELDQSDSRAALLVGTKLYEIWAFKSGHVYAVTVLIDGDASVMLTDAREEDAVHVLGHDLSLLEWRALDGDELESALEGVLPNVSNVSDASESQDDWTVDPLDERSVLTPESLEILAAGLPSESPSGPDAGSDESNEDNDGDSDHPQVVEELTAPVADDQPATSETDSDEQSTGDDDYSGTVADFRENLAELSDDDLLEYATGDSRKGVRELAEHEIEVRQASTDDAAAEAVNDTDPED